MSKENRKTDFVASYSRMKDDELLRLAAEESTLTRDAKDALQHELSNRGIAHKSLLGRISDADELETSASVRSQKNYIGMLGVINQAAHGNSRADQAVTQGSVTDMTSESGWSIVAVQLRGSYLEKQVHRVNRNMLLVSVLMAACVIAYFVSEFRYFYNFFAGPFPTDVSSLATISNPFGQERYFIRITGEETDDSGIQEVEKRTNNGVVQSTSVTADYAILLSGNRLLVVKRPPNATGNTYDGTLATIPSDAYREIVTSLSKQYPGIEKAFLPVMLDATGFRNDGYVALAISLPVLVLAAWIAIRVLRRQSRPWTHPVFQAASQYGSLVDIGRGIDLELREGKEKLGGAIFTRSWILSRGWFTFKICQIPTLVWAYQRVTKHYTNFIPTGKSYAIVIFDRFGQPLQIDARKKVIERILALLGQRAPWAVLGYSDELNRVARADWGAFIKAVEERRHQAVGHSAGS